MKTFTTKNLGQERDKKIMDLIRQDNRHTYFSAACEILSKEFNLQYHCYGGTPTEPITYFKPK